MAEPVTGARLAEVPLFARLPPETREELATRFVSRAYPRGATVFQQGDPGRSLYVIDEGAVKISFLAADGREMVVTVLGPGDVFGEMALFDPEGARSADASAMEAARLLSLSHEVFREYLVAHPSVSVELLGVLAKRLRESDRALQDAIFSDVPGRLARRFLDLAERYGEARDGGTLIELPMTQEELARMVGSSRESVNKAIASFVHRGWLRT